MIKVNSGYYPELRRIGAGESSGKSSQRNGG